jgi:uncharacterized membrane protein YvbJ
MICTACHTENSEHRLFCTQCGKKLTSKRHQCGFINADNDLYCGGCGIPMMSEENLDEEAIVWGEKITENDLNEILNEENMSSVQKSTPLSQVEIDLLFKNQ